MNGPGISLGVARMRVKPGERSEMRKREAHEHRCPEKKNICFDHVRGEGEMGSPQKGGTWETYTKKSIEQLGCSAGGARNDPLGALKRRDRINL